LECTKFDRAEKKFKKICAGEAAPFEAQDKQAVALRAVFFFQAFPAWAKLCRASGAGVAGNFKLKI
jgi:hypothetical protein